MRFAVIGDVHSNIFALESVMNDIEKRDVDFVLSTGDLVGYLPFPNEVIEYMRAKRVLAVQGNHDKHIAFSRDPSVYTNMVINNKNREYLKNLPESLSLQYNGIKVLVVHGSPRSIDEYLFESSEILEEIAQEIDSDIVICGHTHIPYYKVVKGKHYINAGSVGKPKHGNSNSTYVIVEISNQEIKSDIIQVSYEVDKMIRVIQENDMIPNKLINMLTEGY